MCSAPKTFRKKPSFVYLWYCDAAFSRSIRTSTRSRKSGQIEGSSHREFRHHRAFFVVDLTPQLTEVSQIEHSVGSGVLKFSSPCVSGTFQAGHQKRTFVSIIIALAHCDIAMAKPPAILSLHLNRFQGGCSKSRRNRPLLGLPAPSCCTLAAVSLLQGYSCLTTPHFLSCIRGSTHATRQRRS